MFQVFKKRNFSDYINDTISFFKLEGKTFFTNLFTLCGPLLLVLFVCVYFLFDMFFKTVMNDTMDSVDEFLNTNFGWAILIAFVTFIIGIAISILAYTFPIYYLKNITTIPNQYREIAPIKSELKKDFGRLLIFVLGTIFLIFPLMMIVFFISALLIFLIIGLPLLLILLPTFTSWTTIAYYEYVTKKVGFFTAFQTAFYIVKSNFWPIIGNTTIVYLVINIVASILSAIPQVIFYVGVFTSDRNIEDISLTSGYKIMMIAVVILSTILSFFANSLLIINQGMIYYSAREHKENTQSHIDIDMIGNN
ncbi:hypothetical protein VSP20_08740 [Myroides phaeus]|uniref:hypothetical protein n=1 Tax=Myroides phaeus TaxID=702745 RepID=UPI002DB91D6A|nr:hypothetical protein [Myroides phaeus]MEC4117056.1 hypothetical protein [Myroides phaeus]